MAGRGGEVTLDNRLLILSSHLLSPLRHVHTATPTADDVIVIAGNQCGAVLHRSAADQAPPSAPCLPQQAKRHTVLCYQTPPTTTREHDLPAGRRSHTLSTDTLLLHVQATHITADRNTKQPLPVQPRPRRRSQVGSWDRKDKKVGKLSRAVNNLMKMRKGRKLKWSGWHQASREGK